jgi:hypothetical protein
MAWPLVAPAQQPGMPVVGTKLAGRGRQMLCFDHLRIGLGIISCLLSSACAIDLKEATKKLEGQPLSALVAKLGPPLDQRTISGKTVFIWGTPEPAFPGQFEGQDWCQIRATMNAGDCLHRVSGQRNALRKIYGETAKCGHPRLLRRFQCEPPTSPSSANVDHLSGNVILASLGNAWCAPSAAPSEPTCARRRPCLFMRRCSR